LQATRRKASALEERRTAAGLGSPGASSAAADDLLISRPDF